MAIGFAATVVLWLALPAGADDNFPSAGSYSGGLTAQSKWADILKTPGIHVAFPMLDVGNTYVPLPAVCVDGGMLRIGDRRIDNGARVSAARVPRQVPARPAASGYAALRADALEGGDPFAVGSAAFPGQRAQEQPTRSAASGYAALRADALEGGDPFGVGPAALPEPRVQEQPNRPQQAPIGYLVTVYNVNSWFTSMRTALFSKVWEIPPCP